MCKRIIVSIACFGIVCVVGANVERLFADDEPRNADGGQAAETLNTEEEEEADPFGRSEGRVGEMGERRMPMGGTGSAMGGGRGGRFGGRSGPGTFTVVSGDKRSFLLNTTTGDSWLLIVDNPGSHWQPIKVGEAVPQQLDADALLNMKAKLQEDVRAWKEEARLKMSAMEKERKSLLREIARLNDELKEYRVAQGQVKNEEVEVDEKKDVEEGAATSKGTNPFK